MKNPILPVVLCGLGLALAGCGQKETAATPSENGQKSLADSAADAARSAASAVTNITAEVSKKVDAAIAEAQNFLGQGKLQDALGSLNGLSGMALSAEQAALVAGMKEKINTAMTAAGEAGAVAKAAAGEVSAQVQQAVTKAQTLLKEGKFQDALTSLNGLSDLKLSAEQSKLVSDLKAQIQTAKGAGSDAAKAASDLFNRK